MSKTSIEWCARPGTIPETWNPTTGCNKVSQGCKNCYAEIMHKRLHAMGQEKYKHPFLGGAIEHHDYDLLTMPLGWNKPRTVFVNSMSDLFHEKISFDFIDQVFAIMALATGHTFIIITKRADIMMKYFSAGKDDLIERWSQATYEIGDEKNDGFKGLNYDDDESYAECWISNVVPQCWPLPNVWLGVSVEDQKAADERIPLLLHVPATVHFLSCEPLLGHVNLDEFFVDGLEPAEDWVRPIDWIIVGGESGHKARPMHPEWARSLRDQCNAAGVPFFFKQWGEWAPYRFSLSVLHARDFVYTSEYSNSFSHGNCNEEVYGEHIINMRKVGKKTAGRLLDGVEHNAFPQHLNHAAHA